MCVCVLSHFGHVQLFATLWTVAHQDPLSMEFSRQEYWSGLPFPFPGDLPDQGIEPASPAVPASQMDSLPLSHGGSLTCSHITSNLRCHCMKHVSPLYVRKKNASNYKGKMPSVTRCIPSSKILRHKNMCPKIYEIWSEFYMFYLLSFTSLECWFLCSPMYPWFLAHNEKKVKVTESCPTLCDPMDYRVHGILQARILEWVTFPFSRWSSQPRDQTQVSCIAGRFFTSWVIREAQEYRSG